MKSSRLVASAIGVRTKSTAVSRMKKRLNDMIFRTLTKSSQSNWGIYDLRRRGITERAKISQKRIMMAAFIFPIIFHRGYCGADCAIDFRV
jgi:hypothetical protein